MPILTPVGTDTLVNTNTADGQITPRVVALAGGQYMVVWVGAVTVPIVPVGNTIAGSYANADIRGQIYNADGTPSGGEIIVNTTTAGGQLRPQVAQLSNGDVLISWHDGVGPSGGSAETTPNTLRGQRFTSTGVATGAEFVIGNSNGRAHSVAATAGGGFVVAFQEGGVGGALAPGNFVTRLFDANNAQTGVFTIDSSNPVGGHSGTYATVESDGDIVVYWSDRQPNNSVAWRFSRFDATGNILSSEVLPDSVTVLAVTRLATGGHVVLRAGTAPGPDAPMPLFATMYSSDGLLSTSVQVADVPGLIGNPALAALANGGFIASWGIDSDPSTAFNAEIMARAFNAIGNPIGAAFQLNSVTTLNQSGPSLVQLTTGDIIGAWIDDSLLTGDTSGPGIVARRIGYDPVNQNPVTNDFTFRDPFAADGPNQYDPTEIPGFYGPHYDDGYDLDGDPVFISAISNAANGTAVLLPSGDLELVWAPGSPAPLSFDYTLSDGAGGTSTARATIILPTDTISVRMGSTAHIDYLANDFYVPQPGATAFVINSAPSFYEGRASVISTPQGSRILYDSFAYDASAGIYSQFFDLAVGSTRRVYFSYANNENSGRVLVEVQGWAQLGGAGDDNFIGTAAADHLSGGGGTNLLSGLGGDDWYTVSTATTTIIETVGNGVDSVRTSLINYTLPDNVENLYVFYAGATIFNANLSGNELDNVIQLNVYFTGTVFGLGGNDRLIGSSNNDTLNGGDGDDLFESGVNPLFSSAGNDTIIGGAGNDVIAFGWTLSANDVINGGTGNDQVGIGGNYTGFWALNLASTTLTNVEVLALLPGTGNSYNITMHDANVAAGVEMTIFAGNLGAGQNFTFNGSGETDGFFRTFGGLGTDTITGGTQSDGFYFGPDKWQAGDSVVGGGGTNDQLALDGDYTLTIGASADVEVLVLLASPDAGNPNDFNITLSDAWAGAGQSRTVFGRNLTTAAVINGSAEGDANLTFFGGRGSDTLTGGAGSDQIYGLEGNDAINGGAGSGDIAVYQGQRVSYSVVTNMGSVQIVDNDAVTDGDDGTDTVVGIEFARFADQTISITSPIILDLDGGGVQTLSAANSNARFDMDGDGIRDDTSWFGRGEGLLFLDRDGNGTLSNTGEMSFTGDVANARSDLEGLAAFDSNGDGQLSKADSHFRSFKIWRDRNGDGVVGAGEVMSLNRAGVRSLSLAGTANNATTALGDTAIVNTGSFTRTNGRTGGLVDAVLTAFSSQDARDPGAAAMLATDDPLTAMRSSMAAVDASAPDISFDPRISLMAQDMASFGADRDFSVNEIDRRQRYSATPAEFFAA